MFTLEERKYLQSLGQLILRHLVLTTMITTLYGIAAVLLSLSAFVVLQRRVHSQGRSILLCMTALTFLLATAYWATTISRFVLCIQKVLIWSTLGLVNKAWPAVLNRHMHISKHISEWTSVSLMMLNDSTVTWRAWVLCTECRWLMVGPVLLLFTTYMISFIFLVLTTAALFKENFDVPLYVFGALSLSINAISTLVIAYRLWVYRKAWSFG